MLSARTAGAAESRGLPQDAEPRGELRQHPRLATAAATGTAVLLEGQLGGVSPAVWRTPAELQGSGLETWLGEYVVSHVGGHSK